MKELTSPDEFAGFLWRRIEQPGAERRVLLTHAMTSHPLTGNLPKSHLSALEPLFRVRLAEITAKPDATNMEKWIISSIDELLKKD